MKLRNLRVARLELPFPLATMRLALSRWLLILCLALFGAMCAAPSRAQQQYDSETMPSTLPVFEFHSGFWVNLHHFLYHEARARLAAKETRDAAPKPSSPALKQTQGSTVTLTSSEQKTWDNAVSYYMSNYANKDLLINIDLILLKNQIEDFEDCDELTGKKKPTCDAGLPGGIGPILDAVSPIYRSHWWADHDRSNRRWVARVAPLVREQGVGLSERLAEIYQTRWPRDKIRVDVSAYANPVGAYTTLDPLRVTIASADPRNQGQAALEVLFHEASHGIATPVEDAISRECKQREKPIPRDLWHALIIYTTGEVLSPVFVDPAAEKTATDVPPAPKQPGAVPRDLQDILSQRGWEQYHLLLVLYWQPYLDGRVTFEDAIAHLVSAA
jgi:hypothetical protein